MSDNKYAFASTAAVARACFPIRYGLMLPRFGDNHDGEAHAVINYATEEEILDIAYINIVKRAAQAVKAQTPESVMKKDALTLFEVSSVLALVFGKPKEEIMEDMLGIDIPKGDDQ